MKVLIVDDEYYFRKALVETIEWQSLRLEVCGEAENGVEALEMIRTKNPEIVLADINMPKMTGLEFARQVKKYDNHIKIIFISGYDTFEYAKEAISLGADDYLLKPLKEEELYETLANVLKKIYRENQVTSQVEQLRTEKRININFREKVMLAKALLTDSDEEYRNLINKIQDIDTGFDDRCERYVSVICVSENEEGKEADTQLWNFVVENYLEERLSRSFEVLVVNDLEMRVFFLVSMASDDQRDKILEEFRNGQKELQKHFKFFVFSGVSAVHHGTVEIAKAYRETIHALESRTTNSCELVLEYADEEAVYKKYILPRPKRMAFRTALNSGNIEEARRVLEDIFEDAEKNEVTLERFRILCVELLTLCADRMMEISDYEKHEINQMNVFKEVRKKSSFSELEKYILKFSEKICTIKKEEKKPLPENVQKVIDIVEERYADPDLNVDMIARQMYMNYNYLCVVFKKAMDITINDYIFKYRMTKAIEYFNTGNTQVQDVAERIGYSNVGYFTRCFRKEFGITPSQYINTLL